MQVMGELMVHGLADLMIDIERRISSVLRLERAIEDPDLRRRDGSQLRLHLTGRSDVERGVCPVSRHERT